MAIAVCLEDLRKFAVEYEQQGEEVGEAVEIAKISVALASLEVPVTAWAAVSFSESVTVELVAAAAAVVDGEAVIGWVVGEEVVID